MLSTSVVYSEFTVVVIVRFYVIRMENSYFRMPVLAVLATLRGNNLPDCPHAITHLAFEEVPPFCGRL